MCIRDRRKGGRIDFKKIEWFNGGLFDTDGTLPLETVSYTHLDVYKRQAQDRVNQAATLIKSVAKPFGGWIATFQEAIGMNAPALAERLGICLLYTSRCV